MMAHDNGFWIDADVASHKLPGGGNPLNPLGPEMDSMGHPAPVTTITLGLCLESCHNCDVISPLTGPLSL